MELKSHIDFEKLNNIHDGHQFEYKDVVRDDLPIDEHPSGGAAFKREVENGVYHGIVVDDPGDNHIVYKKL